jgi:hypothetical protein
MFSWKSNWILIGALVLLLGGGASAAEKLVLTETMQEDAALRVDEALRIAIGKRTANENQ